MKYFSLLALALSFQVFGDTLPLSQYSYSLQDIADSGLNKEELFSNMNRTLVRTKDSICSNRAHVWAYDFELQKVDSAKIFLFFTKKTSFWDNNSWWYHAAPVIYENGNAYVMDAGFPHRVKSPLLVQDWLKEFNGVTSTCKEIRNEDEHLIKLMWKGGVFPETTESGTYQCYYRLVPKGYWVPNQIAMNYFGTTHRGRGVNVNRDDFHPGEVIKACRETATTEFGYIFGNKYFTCKNFVYSATSEN